MKTLKGESFFSLLHPCGLSHLTLKQSCEDQPKYTHTHTDTNKHIQTREVNKSALPQFTSSALPCHCSGVTSDLFVSSATSIIY